MYSFMSESCINTNETASTPSLKFALAVPPLSVKNGHHPLRVRHAQELLDAVNQAYSNGTTCRLLLLKGTKYGTTKGGIRAAVDPGDWVVDKVSGDVSCGFEFTLERVEQED